MKDSYWKWHTIYWYVTFIPNAQDSMMSTHIQKQYKLYSITICSSLECKEFPQPPAHKNGSHKQEAVWSFHFNAHALFVLAWKDCVTLYYVTLYSPSIWTQTIDVHWSERQKGSCYRSGPWTNKVNLIVLRVSDGKIKSGLWCHETV